MCVQRCAGAPKRVCVSCARHVCSAVRARLSGRACHAPSMCAVLRGCTRAGVLIMCQACTQCCAGALERVCLSCARHVRSAARVHLSGCAYHVPGMHAAL